MEQYELPDGWVWTKINQLADIIMGQSPPSSTYNDEGIGLPFYQGKADFGEVYPTPRKWCSAPGKIAEPGDILISVRAPVGPTNLADTECCIGRGLSAIRPLGRIPTHFVFHYLRSVEHVIADMGQGSTFTAISRSDVENIDIPLAPLPEQLRIAEKIEALFDQSRTTGEALDGIPALLRKFRQSVLAAAFRGDLTTRDPNDEPVLVLLERILDGRYRRWEDELRANGKDPRRYTYEEPALPDTSDLPELPEEWEWVNVGQIADVIGGLTKNSKRQTHSLRLPYVRVANVYANELVLDDVQEIGVLETELERVLLQEGDLLVVEGNGSIDQIGRVAVWDGSIDPCVHQNHIIKVRFDPVEVSRYALFWLMSSQGRDQIIRVASSTSGLYTLSLSKVSALPLPLAPLSEQRRITDRLETLLIQADVLETAVEIVRQRLDRLDQSILERAFRGELVPQDPDDEPASVLLERILAEREPSGRRSVRKARKGNMEKHTGDN